MALTGASGGGIVGSYYGLWASAPGLPPVEATSSFVDLLQRLAKLVPVHRQPWSQEQSCRGARSLAEVQMVRLIA